MEWPRWVTVRVRTPVRSAEEGLAALPVTDHVHRVQVPGVAGRVQDSVAARRRALPGPPAVLGVEWGGLGRELVREPLARLHDRADARRAIAVALARVGVVLADVRGHGQPPDRSSRSSRWKTGDGFV